jgi:hypothetical protein
MLERWSRKNGAVLGLGGLLALLGAACGNGGDDSAAASTEGAGAGAVGPGSGPGSGSGAGGEAATTGSGTGGSWVPTRCTGSTELPADAPALEPGVWTDITPQGFGLVKNSAEDMLGQGIAIVPCNPAVLYWGNTPFDESKGGLFKTANGGASWVRLGDFGQEPSELETSFLDMPLHVRIDPDDPMHLYAGDGVRGSTLGFWVSWDGGQTWSRSQNFLDLDQQHQIFVLDVYDVAVNPTDFHHVLLSSHSDPYVLESKDGGDTWVYHEAPPNIGTGQSIDFLYAPHLGIGNSDTWLLGTQTNGYWRTTDAGDSWTRVTTNCIAHGGGDIYYAKTGVVYASGEQTMRSDDNGATWEMLEPPYSTTVFGDGDRLYTGAAYGFGPIYVSPETDGENWSPFPGGPQAENGGPYEMTFDAANRIIYSSNWERGVMALKLP